MFITVHKFMHESGETMSAMSTRQNIVVIADEAHRSQYGLGGKQSAISSRQRGGRRKPATVFTEYGAVMAASVLNSRLAVEMSIHVVRAFVKLRQVLASSAGVARRLETLERTVAALDANTRQEVVRVYKATLKLMGPASPEQ